MQTQACQSPSPVLGAGGQPFSAWDVQKPLKTSLQCSVSFGLRWGLDLAFLSSRGWRHAGLCSTSLTSGRTVKCLA